MISRPRDQRGVAMFIVLLVVSSLMTVGLLAIYLTLGETKSTAYAVDSKSALYCAEAGLAKARPLIGANYASWAAILSNDTANIPSWYPVTGDIDVPADNVNDFSVTIRDNDDEPTGSPNDLTKDNDMRVFVISKCTRYPETPREVTELIYYTGGGNAYRNQSGQGAGNTGNSN
ncbi:MAG TPA: hypothetical protein VL463_26935 [Kofleriaceae bacterium]|jgi:hypothetical protein|nr:hypothetical protein [Kofleriaceae bacterium]